MDNKTDISIREKPEWISFDEVHTVLEKAHGSVKSEGIMFSTTNLSGEQMEKQLGKNGVCFVAMDADKVVGTLSVNCENRKTWYASGLVAHIRFVAVLPEYQGCHIGGNLVKVALDWINEKNIDVTVVSTPEKNIAAINLYRHNGFKLVEFFTYQEKFCVRLAYWTIEEPYSEKKCMRRFNNMKFKLKAKKVLRDFFTCVKGEKMKGNTRTKNSVLNLITSLGGQLLLILLRFVTRTVFIEVLGKSFLGINGLFSDILTMLSLTELGFDTAINYKLYKPLAKNDEKRVRVLLKFYKMAYQIIGFVITIIGLCLIPLLRYIINDYDSLESLGVNPVLVFVLYLFQSVSSYLFFAYRSVIMKAAQKEYVLNLAGYVITLATNVCQIIVLLSLQDFIAYTLIVLLFNIIQNMVDATIAKHYFPQYFINEKENLSKTEIIDMLKDCGALFVYKINGVVLKATDNMVLSAFIGLTIVGMYSNYLMFYMTIRTLLTRVYNALKASMGNLFTVANMEKRYCFFEVMNFVTIILFGTAGVGITVVANEMIECWIGMDYVIPQPFPVLLGIEILFLGLKNNLGQIRNITGVFRQMWFRPVLGIITNLGVSIATVNFWGIYGVLLGTITADLLTNFMVDPVVIHKNSFENYKPVTTYYIKNIKYIILLVVICIVDMVICSNVLVGAGWFSVIVHCVICGISVPMVFIIVFRKSEECNYLINKVGLLFNKKKEVV